MPLTVGGGIRNLDDIRTLLSAGADKVSINSAAVRDPELVRQAARRFGSQCIVVNIDPKRVNRDGDEIWEVHINGGRVPTGKEAVSWAREVEQLGAGEIVLTSMDADGTRERLRPGDDAGRGGRGRGPGGGFRRSGPPRAPAGGPGRRRSQSRPWPRAFSTTGTFRSEKPKNTWRARACPSGSSSPTAAQAGSRLASSPRDPSGDVSSVNRPADLM